MLYMISLNVSKSAYQAWMQVRGHRDQQSSLHYLLDSTFGPSALKPYRAYPGSGDTFQVLAYTTADPEALKATTQLIACPDSLEVIDMSSVRSKEMPELAEGQVIGFDLKTVPIRRKEVGKKNVEMDAYEMDVQAGTYQRGSASAVEDRVESYMRWLGFRLGQAADLDLDLTSIMLLGQVPRQRKKICYQQEIQVTGNLTVRDPKLMQERIVNGVGRHKSYGYGMLILRAPQLNHRINKAA